MTENNKEVFFSKEKQEKARKWLETRWRKRECECCGHNNWLVADFLCVAPRFEGGISIGGSVAPQLMVTCINCSNTKFFNAVMMGVVKGKEGNDGN